MDFTADFVEREYNNRAAVPDHPRWLARYAELSAAAVAQLRPQADLRYGPGPKETLDLYLPPGPPRGTFVFLHGGYWRALDKRDFSYVAAPFVAQGLAVANVNYDLCPDVTVGAIVTECERAIAWLVHEGAARGAAVERIVVAGHSAGGHLAAMLLACDWAKVCADLPADLLRCAIAISGVFDLEPLVHTPFLLGDLRLTAESARRLSPALYPPPPGTLYALAGANESEEFLRQNRLIREAWGALRVPVCETVPGTNHLDVLIELADPQARLHHLALELLGLEIPVPAA